MIYSSYEFFAHEKNSLHLLNLGAPPVSQEGEERITKLTQRTQRTHSSKSGSVNHFRWKFNILQKILNELGPAWQKLKETITFTDKRISPLAIQIQEALWRRINNLKLLFSRKGRDLRFKRGRRKCSCTRGQIMPTRNNNRRKLICVSWPLSMNQAPRQNLLLLIRRVGPRI